METRELKKIIPWQELRVIERSRELRKVLEIMAKSIERLPSLRETDGDKTAECVLHYFDTCGAADWYIFELDMETLQAFGYVTFSGDIADPYAEFGYIDIGDLCRSARINLDLHFSGITKGEILKRKFGKTA
jgi:hypothetical protein